MAQQWLAQLPVTALSIDNLVEEGLMGCSEQDLLPWLAEARAFEAISRITWVKTKPDGEGEVALMTSDVTGLDELLEWMLESRGFCPKVYAPEEEPIVPGSLVALMPTAYNLPEGSSSEEVLTEEMLKVLAEIFQDLKQAYGNHAHLHRLDYGVFMAAVDEHDVIVLTGQFIDLNDGELYDFTLDGIKQRLRYSSTGVIHPAFAHRLDGAVAEPAHAASSQA
ncbi:hypothetical protein [Cyanobium sp. Morenito 9A2]|uniref:hypothetical protein n=1 Tax=Cyanobium sp. Morenito 9A2 TaxID=2823718 RepID=UPI0020CB9E22|nr:hypothetical protein [Cyanobium sp. Morenito 9A2]MCP9850765.1 hypothetical protein [Cyanobium sp. Morenito 9A2]